MYKKNLSLRPGLLVLSAAVFLSSCQKGNDDHGEDVKLLKPFKQVNLVANNAEHGSNTRIDNTLVNAWGIVFSPNGNPWVTSEGGHVSEVYNSEGEQALPAVNIPSPTDLNGGGSPTGIIINPNATDFIIPSGNASPQTGARFIFVGLDGVVAAWNGTWGNHSYRKFDRSSNSAYTGLALATNDGSSFLYAANFRSGKIDVWNKNWEPASLPFKDPGLPAGYSPFNIQNIKNQLYVLYAKVAASGKNDPGLGKGFVDVYNPDGSFVRRLISRGQLNSPWGVALTSSALFTNDNKEAQDVLLVGNFGDGHINAFRLSDGKFIGQLATDKKPIVIEGLWAISFPPATSTVDPNRLYFAAGPAGETEGLFGYIIPYISQP